VLGKWFNALLNYWLLFEWSTTVRSRRCAKWHCQGECKSVTRAKLEASRTQWEVPGKDLSCRRCVCRRERNCELRFISFFFLSPSTFPTEHFLFDPSVETLHLLRVTNRACSFEIWFSRILRTDEFSHEYDAIYWRIAQQHYYQIWNRLLFMFLPAHNVIKYRENKRKAFFMQSVFC